MNEDSLLKRIEKTPHVISGRPRVAGQRVTVDHVVAMLVSGMTPRQVIDQHPGMVELDVQAAVVWARRFLHDFAGLLEENHDIAGLRDTLADWTETESRLVAMAVRLSQPVLLELLHAHEAAGI